VGGTGPTVARSPQQTTRIGDRRVAIVTGGSRGIGRETARRLAADGYAVVIGYAADEQQAATAIEEVRALGADAVAVRADVGDENAVASLFDVAEKTFGGVDVVVNAAGKARMAPIADLDLTVLDDIHRTNVRGTFIVAQQAARRARPGGAVINFSSSVVNQAFANYGAYTASKSAVEAVTMILARELRGRNVSVNAVSPGPTGKDEDTIARFAAQPPLERLGRPADIAEVVAFLASPAGHWVNGQVVRVNGGVS
jgi:3-oxoacyl-[acyl-carrier protein] reductase